MELGEFFELWRHRSKKSLDQTEEDAVCYKSIGPALVPKTLAETKELIKQRQATTEEQLKKWVIMTSSDLLLMTSFDFLFTIRTQKTWSFPGLMFFLTL